MGDNGTQNTKDLKKEQNKIVIFLKENIVIIMFFVINMIVSIGLYFTSETQKGLIKNTENTIENYIDSINEAVGKVDVSKGKKISIFKDKKKIDSYEKALNKFIEMFGKNNLKVQISQKKMGINKYYLDSKPDINKIQDYVYWGLSNGIKIQITSYPVKSKKFSVLIIK